MAPANPGSEGKEAEGRQLLDTLEKLHPLVLVWRDDFEILWLSREGSGLLATPSEDKAPGSAVDFFHALAEGQSPESIRRQLMTATSELANGRGPVNARLDLGCRNGTPLSTHIVLLAGSADAEQNSTFCLFEIQTSAREDESDVSTLNSLDSPAFEFSPDPILAIGSEGEILRLNRAASELESAVSGERETRTLPVAPGFREPLTEALETLTPMNDAEFPPIQLQRNDGTRSYFTLFARALGKAGAGQAAHLVWLRETHAPESRTGVPNGKLDRGEDLIHDLRSPLVSLIGFARLLNEDYADLLDEPGRRFTHRIEEAALKIKTTLEKLENSS